MALLARLPWPMQRGLGRGSARCCAWRCPRAARVAERNLELCFPELDAAARAALLRAHFAALGIGLFEFARAWWGSVAPDAARACVVEGLEHIEAARARGRGVIVVSGHFTTLEICGRLMCDHVPLAGMYRPHAQPAMEWAVKRGRLRYAAAMFTKRGTAPCGEAPQAGRSAVVRAGPGPEPRRQRVRAVLRPARVQPDRRRTSSRACPARRSSLFQHERRDDGGYTLRIVAGADGFPSHDATADTAQVMAAIEAMARAAPDQYLWIHRRFKRQPDGSSPYGGI